MCVRSSFTVVNLHDLWSNYRHVIGEVYEKWGNLGQAQILVHDPMPPWKRHFHDEMRVVLPAECVNDAGRLRRTVNCLSLCIRLLTASFVRTPNLY